jgi:hypothetical protein
VSNESITYLVAACAGVFSLAAFVGLILAPAWASYTRAWERVAAALLSLYVLAAMVGVGVLGGVTVVWFWDRIAP